MASILIIDDDPDALSILGTFLEAQGHDARRAATGQEGLAALERDRPDLVILDVMMPGMDGWEVARRIRDRPELNRTRILMLTARGDRDSRREALEAGADYYLVKPLSLQELATRIKRALRDTDPEPSEQ
jgi:DNA-binding response OmpR family regulator